MKKAFYILTIFLLISLLNGCARGESSGATAREITDAVRETAAFEKPLEEDMSERETAEKYGISPELIKEGFILYDGSEKNPDKIIIVIAKNDSGADKIERALSGERIRLVNALENDKSQYEKVNNIIVKAKGRYCALIFCGGAKAVEKIFDDLT